MYADADRVLKVPFQGEERHSGWRAQVRFPPGIGPRIYEVDEDTGIVLMERLRPGYCLHEAGLSDEATEEIFFGIAKEIRNLPTHGLLGLGDFFGGDQEVTSLPDSTPHPTFLHGDLHHYNILRGTHGWRVIDPKGLVGDPAFEAAAFLRNPYLELAQRSDLPDYLAKRIQRLAVGLDVSADRVLAWSVRCMPSGDDNSDGPWRTVGRALRSLSGPDPRSRQGNVVSPETT